MLELARAKRDDLAFAQLIGQPLEPWQRVDLETPITTLRGSRGIGKSNLIIVKALRLALAKAGLLILFASSADQGSRRLIGRASVAARAHPALQASFEAEALGKLVFRNGSTILAIATSEISARGWVADFAFLDEAQLLSQDFVDALIPTVTATGGKVLLCGTGGVREGPFFNLCKAGDVGSEHIRSHLWVPKLAGGSHDASWLSASVVEAARETMSPQRFAAEYQGSFESGSDAVFPYATLQRAICDYLPTPWAEFQPKARISAGIDWGERSDRSCVVAVGRFAGTSIFGVCSVRRFEPGALIPGVIAEIAATPAHIQAWFSERNAMGASATQYLWAQVTKRPAEVGGGRRPHGMVIVEEGGDRTGFPPRPNRSPKGGAGFHSERLSVFTDGPMKSSVFGSMRIGIEADWLKIPAVEVELISELTHLKSEITQTGERISGTPHDDLAMAFMLALAPTSSKAKGGTTWRSRVADLARGHVPPADLPSQLASLPTVSSGSVEIPKNPCWQSLVGGELTLPVGIGPIRPEVERSTVGGDVWMIRATEAPWH